MPQNLSDTSTGSLTAPLDFSHSLTEFASVINLPAPAVFKVDVGDLKLNDKQFAQIERANPEWKIELSGTGELIFMPSIGFIGGVKNTKLIQRVANWAESDGTGEVGDSSTAYVLPNGAIRSPDVSWILRDKLKNLTQKQMQGFAPLAPDFVIELRSPSDSLKILQDKMTEYSLNGVRLGWLIDPHKRLIHVYRPNQTIEILENPQSIGGETVLNNFTLDLTEIWETKIG